MKEHKIISKRFCLVLIPLKKFILKLKEKSTFQMQINFVVNMNKIYKLSMLLILSKYIV